MEWVYQLMTVLIVLISAGLAIISIYTQYKTTGKIEPEKITEQLEIFKKIADLAADSKDAEMFIGKIKDLYMSGGFNAQAKDALLLLTFEFAKRRTNSFDFNTVVRGIADLKVEDRNDK